MKKRPKYIQEMVNRANRIFKQQGVKNENESDLFAMVCEILLEKDMYRGFNFYKTVYRNGQQYDQLAGVGDSRKVDFIQIW